MKIDFSVLNLRELTMDGAFPLSEDKRRRYLSVVSRYETNGSPREIFLEGKYNVSGAMHFVHIASFLHKEKRLIVHFSYSAVPPGKVVGLGEPGTGNSNWSKVEALVEGLTSLAVSGTMQCAAEWVFKPNTFHTVVALPLMTMEGVGVPFHQIRGVRLSHGGGARGEPGEVATLDLVDQVGTLAVGIRFTHRDRLDKGLPERVLRMAQERVQRYVRISENGGTDGTVTAQN